MEDVFFLGVISLGKIAPLHPIAHALKRQGQETCASEVTLDVWDPGARCPGCHLPFGDLT